MLSKNQQKLLRKLQSPRQRRKTGLFLCEGKRACEEALKVSPEAVDLLIVTARGLAQLGEVPEQVPQVIVEEKEFAEWSQTESPQGVMVVVKEPSRVEGELNDAFALILDRVTDPGNLGTIVRTAWAVGLTEVWYTAGTTDPYSCKAVRSSMGAHFYLKFRSFNDLAEIEEQLAETGGKLFLAKPGASCSCFGDAFQFDGNGVVFGNEANGIEYSSDRSVDLAIPMPGPAESLNVAQAATIVLFEHVRRTCG